MAKRDINSVQLICSYGLEHGLSQSTLLEGSSVGVLQLSDANVEIDAQQELKVIKNLLQHLGQPFRLGVELGSRYQLTTYGIMGYALLASQTMREAIALSQRYLALTYAFCNVEYFEDDEGFSIIFTPPVLNELGLLILVRDLWAAAVIQKELFAGKHIPYTLHLQCDFPEEYKGSGIEALENTLGGKIEFNARHNAFKGPIVELDRPLAKANEMTARLCEEQCRELLIKKQDWPKVSEQIRDILLNEGLGTSMIRVAQRMARTERTLHRQLKEESTTWRKVRDNVRIGLAEELLQQPLLLDEIAERLGYSDATNFSHSFKRCRGCSPGQYRKQNKVLIALP